MKQQSTFTGWVFPSVWYIPVSDYPALRHPFDALFSLSIQNGSGGGAFTNNAVVAVSANPPQSWELFAEWTAEPSQYVSNVASCFATNTTFTMPAVDVVLTATYKDAYVLTVNGGAGSGLYTNQQQVEIIAVDKVGMAFDKWTGATQYVVNAASATTTVTMPAEHISLTATYTAIQYTLTINSGSGDGLYTNGAQVEIVADDPAIGKAFDRWTDATQYIANVASATTTVTMPTEAITVTATYKDNYVLTVENGTGSGAYSNQQQVAIAANAPSSGHVFAKWIGATQYVADVTSESTFVTMLATNITVTATYKTVYALTVNGGDGSGSYTNGAKVTITATPVVGKAFLKWLGATQYVAGVTSSRAVVTMPTNAISLTASNVVDTTKPTVAISSPKAAQRILSNATFTVTGTAADNKVVTNVMVKFNDGAYASAVSSNGWKTWSAQVQLVAGSNTVRAYSVDSAFNNSTTATVACTYVVVGNLTIQTNGAGTVARTPTGAPEVNKTYTLTAAAGTGSVFLNWTGAVNNPTNKVTTFVMTSNMTIRANFTDIAKPTVTITAPMALQKVYGTNGDFVVRGTAADNLALSNVMVKVNSGSFVPASPASTNGLKTWTLPVTLTASNNTIAAYSIDTTGNCSVTVTMKCVYVETGSLTITTNGPGKVTVSPTGTLELNKTYTLTAAANAGAVFSNWTGDVIGSPTSKVVKVMLDVSNKTKTVAANFTDTSKPTVVITYPANNAKVVTNGLVIIRGTAADNHALAEVKYQLYDGTWTNAASTNNLFKNWTAPYVPAAGLNTSKVYSVDMQGNSSATSTVVFTYLPGAIMTVRINGQGTITPSYNGKVLQIGATNTMTATAKSGHAFVFWLDEFWNIIPSSRTIKFVMQPNLVLVASFRHLSDDDPHVDSMSQTSIIVDGAVEDWVDIPRSTFSYSSVTQEVAVALDGNNIALLLNGCPFSTSDTLLVYFKLHLTYGEGDNRHTVDLWTRGSVPYGMVDGQVITSLEAVLLGGVLEVKIPVEQAPSQVTIEEVGCGMDIGTGALTELFKYTF
jgi:hypothetical protein